MRHHTFHVNVIRKWKVLSAAVFLAEEEGIDSLMNGKEVVSTHTTLSSLHLIKLGEFKEKYIDVLQDVPGRITLVAHAILLGKSPPPPPPPPPPVRIPPNWLAHNSQETLKEEIKTLLSQGIIKSSTSPCATLIALVAKKDGTQWMCVDYLKLNTETFNGPYPLPKI